MGVLGPPMCSTLPTEPGRGAAVQWCKPAVPSRGSGGRPGRPRDHVMADNMP